VLVINFLFSYLSALVNSYWTYKIVVFFLT
jgi:hypothetical protein